MNKSESTVGKRLANSLRIRITNFVMSMRRRGDDAETQRRSPRKATLTELDTDTVRSRTVWCHSATFAANLRQPSKYDRALTRRRVQLANMRAFVASSCRNSIVERDIGN